MHRAIAVCAACLTLLLAGCGNVRHGPERTVVAGHPVAMLYDPGRVGGLPAAEGPSGPRGDVPPVTARVTNSDDGTVDRLALLAIDDIEDFWTRHYGASLPGVFTPVSTLVSYDSTDPAGPQVCGADTYRLLNAMYCHRLDVLAWDRGKFIPTARKYFGDMAINGTLAHEYGHAVQWMAALVDRATPVLVREQQADCLAGVYLQWVAAGSSPRVTLSTGDGLNHVLAGLIVIRDPISTPDNPVLVTDEHGTALDRIGAFQVGFDGGAEPCAGIDMAEIGKRRGDLPPSLFSASAQSDVVIDTGVLATLMQILQRVYSPAHPPTLATALTDCPGVRQSAPAAYCPASNTVAVDLPALQELGAPSDQSALGLPEGDNTALSVVTSRYALAVQQQHGVRLDTPTAALRTACLTGVAQRQMAEPIALPSGGQLVLGGGDLDEAVTGLVLNGLAASDVNGDTVPAAFTRILAFRSGLHSDVEQCFTRFSDRG